MEEAYAQIIGFSLKMAIKEGRMKYPGTQEANCQACGLGETFTEQEIFELGLKDE